MSLVTTLPRGRPLTRADLDGMPDDGHRYELIDGVLVVSPSPSRRHQDAVLGLAVILRAACSKGFWVVVAPFDVALTDDTVLIPDILVARDRDLTDRDLPAAPVLAVEVLSPSTRRFDLMTKRSRYESAGTASYWVVDTGEASLTAWELDEHGTYQQVAHVLGNERFRATAPFAVEVVPAHLLVSGRSPVDDRGV